MVQDGDPWAAAVIRALRSMKVPAWVGKLTNDRPFQFRLIICKDGRTDTILHKQSTGDGNLDTTLSYPFSWSATDVG